MNFRSNSNVKNPVAVGLSGKTPYIQNTVANNSFPYRDEYEEFDYSDEELELVYDIKNKISYPDDGFDPMHARDRSSFQDISKVTEIASGLSPFPTMYKNREGHLGKSAKSINNTHSHGFYVGSRISGHTYDRENLEDDDDLPVYSLEDLAIKQLKEYVRIVLMEVL